ncbi:nucleoside hydrolase [Paenibacillus alginolyticus]|uniref:Nucleoside hydrolase n=1 Tax=Paenibacillus alginolyticus TaxID=59839 RepID=A0ABT4G6B2_9BACL|nr:nucleoside hydrolase [Paenibacillus alginolyticus]MCY9691689.1 nucleoside hydrolase [Paenibacillus alginolyticus]MEC0146875.1 nucleoside hydrolase [Paenibacillus alginolyticus]
MKPIILDVDTGIDDALAISYAVNSPEVELLGVTTCFGNVTVQEATRNTLLVLEHLDSSVPVIPGASKPLFVSRVKASATHIHGEDGIGNTLTDMSTREASKQYGPQFIIDQVRSKPHQVTIITVAAMTNLALAIMQAPDIVGLVDKVVVMGGAVTRAGNVTPHAEANIYADPEAADYVFASGIPITLVGLDVTMETLLPKKDVQVWRDKQTALSTLLADMTDFYIDAYEDFYPGIGGCGLHDPLAVGVAINPDFVKTKPLYVRVDLDGFHSLGRTVGDLRSKPANEPNMDVCLEVDAERFLEHFLSKVV